jgi:hypothetical protein
MHASLHAGNFPYFLFDFRQNLNVSTSFSKTSNIKFHENPLSGSGVVIREQTAQQTRILVTFTKERAKNWQLFSKVPKEDITESTYTTYLLF